MRLAAAALALLTLLACHQAPTTAPSTVPPLASALAPAPKRSLALLPRAGIYAVATAERGGWRIDLHLGGAEETRPFEGRSPEGFAITVLRQKQGPVASWTLPAARFLSGRPIFVTLETTGGDIPLRLDVPAIRPDQTVAGLNVAVVK